MAIVKANYTRSRGKIKASVRYIQHRPGKDGERITRTLFGVDGALSRDDAYKLIDEAPKGTNFFRIVISPDPKWEDIERDLRLREITEETMLALSKQLEQTIQYIGAIHDDHAAHRHVHLIALIKGRLTRKEFQLLRKAATGAARFQRLERDAARGIVRQQGGRFYQGKADGRLNIPRDDGGKQVRSTSGGGGGGGSSLNRDLICPVCGMPNCALHKDELKLER